MRICRAAVSCKRATNIAAKPAKKRDRKRSRLHASATTEPARSPCDKNHCLARKPASIGQGASHYEDASPINLVASRKYEHLPSLIRRFSNPAFGTFRLPPDARSAHTPTMTLKNAAMLALIGTVLMTALLVWNFAFNVLNLLRGLVPAATLFSSLIYAFGVFSVMVFFFVFHRAQS